MSAADIAAVDNVSVQQVWDRLSADATAQLIDVRTRAEWAFVGLPDLTSLGKQPLLIEWSTFPDNRIDASFADRLDAEFKARGVAHETEIFFICRSGGRSLMAARALAGLGYRRCHNVAEGFEGPLDALRHRGGAAGWKAAGLPWVQG